MPCGTNMDFCLALTLQDQYVLIHKVMMCFLKTFQIYENFGPAMASTNTA